MKTQINATQARPNEVQAIKILKKLASEYEDFYPPSEQAYLQDYIASIRLGDPDLTSVVRTISRLLTPAIENEIGLTYEEIEDCEDIQDETLSAIAQIYEDAGAVFEFQLLDDITMDLIEHDEDQKQAEALNLRKARFDLRSLERALTTLSVGEEAEFTRHDALMQIMQCAYD